MSDVSFTQAFSNPDRLGAGDFPIETRMVTILAGQNLIRGAVLGRISVGGKYVLSLAAANDGSEMPSAILAQDVDASAGDKLGIAYLSGDFNEDRITLGAGHTLASVRDTLRGVSIYLKNPVSA